jgi:hypothetical protein
VQLPKLVGELMHVDSKLSEGYESLGGFNLENGERKNIIPPRA